MTKAEKMKKAKVSFAAVLGLGMSGFMYQTHDDCKSVVVS